MKRSLHYFILILSLSFINQFGLSQGACVNADFTSLNFNGWTGKYGSFGNPSASTGIVNGRHTIISTPGIDPRTCGGLQMIPPGSTVSAKLGNESTGSQAEQLLYTVNVTQSNALFVYKYAVVLEDPGHSSAQQPAFNIRILNASGVQIGGNCGMYSVYGGQPGQNFQNCGSARWLPWTTVGVDLTPYIGQNISIEFTTKDCSQSGHYGYAYISAACYPLNITTTFCVGNNSATLTGPPGFQSYTWNPGNVSGQSMTINNPTIGATYTLTMTSFSNQGTCTVNSSTTINQTVITPDFTYTPACTNEEISFTDATGITDGILGSWLWNFGDGTTSTLQNPTHIYSNSGTYTVTLTSYSTTGCSNSITKQVTPHPKPITAFTTVPNPVCINDMVQFSNQTQDPLPLTYEWDFGTGVTSTQVNPSIQFTVDGTYPVSLIAINSNGCRDTMIQNLIVNPLPLVDAGIDFTTCPNMPTTISGSGAVTFVWNNGVVDGQPFIPTTSNIYTVTGTDANGCINTDQVYIEVFPVPIMNPGADQEACSGSQIILSATGVNSYAWSGGITNGVGFVPPVGTHTYYVTGTDGNGCEAKDSVIVVIHDLPLVDGGLDRDICELSNTILIGQGAQTYVWDNGVQNGVPFSPTSTNVYTVTGTDANGCVNTDVVVVNVEPMINVQFNVSDSFACAPFVVNFVNTTTTNNVVVSTHWDFGDGNSSNLNGNTSNTYFTTGCYDITLTQTTQLGCVWSTTYNDVLCVYPTPTAMFQPSPSTLTNLNPVSVMMNGSLGATNYIWNFDDGSAYSIEEMPKHTFPSDKFGLFDIELIAISEHGCRDTAYNKVYIYEDLVYYIPNTFTPDNDNFNQTFAPVFVSGYDPYDFTMTIYDRWGAVIFVTHDSQIGWTGTYGSGSEIAPSGSYIWKIEYSNLVNGMKETRTGHVNLLK